MVQTRKGELSLYIKEAAAHLIIGKASGKTSTASPQATHQALQENSVLLLSQRVAGYDYSFAARSRADSICSSSQPEYKPEMRTEIRAA